MYSSLDNKVKTWSENSNYEKKKERNALSSVHKSSLLMLLL